MKRDPSEIVGFGGGWVVVRDRPEDVRAYVQRVADHHGIGAPVPRAAGDPDTVAQRLFDYWQAGEQGFVLSGAYPFDHETIDRVGREVRPRLMKLIERSREDPDLHPTDPSGPRGPRVRPVRASPQQRSD